MTGSPRPGIPPRTDADWARSVEERLGTVEVSPATRVGDWVLYTDPDTGNLNAANVNGGAVVLSTIPDPGVDPDAVSAGLPILKVQRQTNQTTASNDALLTVMWDNIDIQIGRWGLGGSEAFDTITIPEDGIYRVAYSVAFNSGANASTRSCYLLVDGVTVLFDTVPGSAAQPGPAVTDILALSAGQAITAQASRSGTLSSDIGPNPTYPLVVPSLSLERIR